jgi:hypothetical protein
MDAPVTAVTVLECSLSCHNKITKAFVFSDNPLFNTAKGVVFNVQGKVNLFTACRACKFDNDDLRCCRYFYNVIEASHILS